MVFSSKLPRTPEVMKFIKVKEQNSAIYGMGQGWAESNVELRHGRGWAGMEGTMEDCAFAEVFCFFSLIPVPCLVLWVLG